MIRTRDIGNPFAPAYRAHIWVDDIGTPCGDLGRRAEAYVPAWGFVDTLRSLRIIERWAAKNQSDVPAVRLLSDGTHKINCGYYREASIGPLSGFGETPDAARADAAAKLLTEDPTLGEDLWPADWKPEAKETP